MNYKNIKTDELVNILKSTNKELKSRTKPTYTLNQFYLNVKLSLENEDQEKVVLITFKNNIIINKYIINIGGYNQTILDLRQITKNILNDNANAIGIAHNHPTGYCEPSQEDLKMTDKLKKLCGYINVTLLEHLIICKNNFYSFKQNELI